MPLNLKNGLAVLALLNMLSRTAYAADASSPVILDPKLFDPKRPLARELEMSVADGFTLGAVGDCIISRPLSQNATRDADFANVLKHLRQSDALVGNLETTIVDIREFKGYPFSWDGDSTLLSDPAVAEDLAVMGFDLFSRANNHVLDWGLEGMRETSRRLDAAGIIHAGTGESYGIARSAQYFESTRGRIGIVSMVSSFRPTTEALPPQGAAPGRPGVSALAVKKIAVVPPQMMEELAKINCTVSDKNCEKSKQQPASLSLFGTEFQLGKGFRYRYEMDPVDFQEILKSIRQGKNTATSW